MNTTPADNPPADWADEAAEKIRQHLHAANGYTTVPVAWNSDSIADILRRAHLPKPEAACFEVVDASDEERYWPLGMFPSLAEAMSLLDGDEPPYNDDDSECAVIEVRKRPFGFHPHAFTTIASRIWVRNYEDNQPEWTAEPIKHHEQR